MARLLLIATLALAAGCGEEKKPADSPGAPNPTGAPADPGMFDKSKVPKTPKASPKAS